MMFPKKKRVVSRTVYKSYSMEHPYCEWPGCAKNRWLGPHHIIFRSQGGGDIEDNLISLCKEHHDRAHGKESREVRLFLLKLKE